MVGSDYLNAGETFRPFLVHLLFVHQDSRLRLLQQDVVTCCHFLPFRFRQGKYLLLQQGRVGHYFRAVR